MIHFVCLTFRIRCTVGHNLTSYCIFSEGNVLILIMVCTVGLSYRVCRCGCEKRIERVFRLFFLSELMSSVKIEVAVPNKPYGFCACEAR